jgi:hypothetical protein
MQGRAARRRDSSDASSSREQELGLGDVAGAPHQRRRAHVVGSVGVRPCIQQQAHAFRASHCGGIQEGGVSLRVLCARPGSGNQLLESREIVVTDGGVKRALLGRTGADHHQQERKEDNPYLHVFLIFCFVSEPLSRRENVAERAEVPFIVLDENLYSLLG